MRGRMNLHHSLCFRLIIVALLFIQFTGYYGEICSPELISFGQWERANIQRKQFPCHFNPSDLPLENATYKIAPSPPRYFHVNRKIYEYTGVNGAIFTIDVSRSCDCDFNASTLLTVSEREKWIWKPEFCSAMEWNATEFCRILGHRRILTIGDSTQSQATVSLINLINYSLDFANCSDHISHHWTPHLTEYTSISSEHGNDTYLNRLIRDSRADIIIFGVGPHYHNVSHFETDVDNLIQEIYRLNEIYTPKKQFIWKSISAPHGDCEKFHEPIHSTSPYQHALQIFSWDYFPLYDEYARLRIRENGIEFMDMYPLKLRPDAHVGSYGGGDIHSDCNHYCLPGPVSVFAILLMHFLI